MIGDGSTLPIQHTSSFSLSVNTSSHKFHSTNVLHVPSISCNILSISQICKDNNTSIEFLASFFRVNGISQGTILLQGPTRAGVYEWSPSLHHAFTSIKLPTHD